MEFTVKTQIKTSASEIYTAWLDSELHTKMTGGSASISAEINGEFTAWDGYIQGKNIELVPFNRIVQSWRTTEFESNEEDSFIEISFEEENGETTITLLHKNLSDSGLHYLDGWKNHYFTPMKAFFEG